MPDRAEVHGWKQGLPFIGGPGLKLQISQKGITEEKELVRENRTAAQEAAQEGMSVEAFCVEFEQPSLHTQKKIAIHATCLRTAALAVYAWKVIAA